MMHRTLARTITSQLEVAALDDAALVEAIAGHEAEILSLGGRIQAASDQSRTEPARRAMRVLKLHLDWLKREQRARQRRVDLVARQAGREAAERQQRQAIEAKTKRIAMANSENTRGVELFKEVAREVLGMEMYEHLWELVRQRQAASEAKG